MDEPGGEGPADGPGGGTRSTSAGEDRRDQHRASRARRWWPILLAPVVVVLYGLGIAAVGVEKAVATLASAWPPALVGALVLQMVVTATWPFVYHASVMAVGERIGYLQALNVSMSTFTVSRTLPGGGPVGAGVAVERLTRSGVSGPAATASVFLTGPVSLTTIVGLGAVGITVAVLAGELPEAALLLAVLGLGVMAALLGAVVAAIRSPRVGERVIDMLAGVHRRLERRASGWRESWRTVTERAPTPGDVARIFAWSSCKWAVDIGSLALVFVAFNQTPRVSVLLVGFFVAEGLAILPLSPGGLGLVEGGMVGAFVVLGVELTTATTVVLTYRVFDSWLPTLAGVPVLLWAPQRT